MSAYKIQTLGNYPEENIQHTEHGESLKSRTILSVRNCVAEDFVLLGYDAGSTDNWNPSFQRRNLVSSSAGVEKKDFRSTNKDEHTICPKRQDTVITDTVLRLRKKNSSTFR